MTRRKHDAMQRRNGNRNFKIYYQKIKLEVTKK